MNIPHRCPVCEGRGEVGKRLAQVNSVIVSTKPLRFRCHSCHGTGIVWDTTFNFPLTPFQPYTSTGDCPGIVNPSPIISWNNPKIGPDGSPLVPLTTGTFGGDPGKNGNNCACSPWGEPHSDNCKAWYPITDGVARCKSCNEPIYMAPGKGCTLTSSHMKGN